MPALASRACLWKRACVAIARDLEANKLVDTSGNLATEALPVGCRKLVKEGFVLVGVGNGLIVDPNDDKEIEPLRLGVKMHGLPLRLSS
eukprot:1068169-Pleurochrysis_carterae.AAC.1